MKEKASKDGQLWMIKISDSTIDFVHGFGREIAEVYIVSKGISLNCADGEIHCFKSDAKERYEGGRLVAEFEVPNKLIELAENYINVKDELKVDFEKFSDIIDMKKRGKSELRREIWKKDQKPQ